MGTVFPLADAPPATICCLGNFDGVHLGHQALLQRAAQLAARQSLPWGVLTLEPHPRQIFNPTAAPFRLTSAADKHQLLHQAGAHWVTELAFTPQLSQLSPDEFLALHLAPRKIHHLFIGADFHFAKNRAGNADWLLAHSGAYGITTHVIEPLTHATSNQASNQDSDKIHSSSEIRRCLELGQIDEANALLGRPHRLSGVIQTGDQRGRQLGFPTANMDLGDYLRPAYGVYAVRVTCPSLGLDNHAGVANLGRRPTLDGSREWFEIHLMDWQGDAYGSLWQISLHHFIRREQKFANLDALVAQIHADKNTASQLLAA